MSEYSKWLAEQNGLAANSIFGDNIGTSQLTNGTSSNGYDIYSSNALNKDIAEQTDKILGNSNTFDTNKQVLVNSASPYDTGNLYSGTVNGVQTTLGQNDLSKFDPGSVTNAQVNGQLYNGTDGTNGEWGYKEWGTAGNLGLGAGQLGLGIASYFENKKTADAQRKLLSQQYASNAEAIADRRANKAALANIKIK